MFDRISRPGLLPFLVGSLIASALVLYLILSQSDTGLFLWVNRHHHPFLDLIFSHFTHVGDGLFYVAIILLSIFISKRWFFTALFAFAISSLISILCKEVLFHGAPRPKLYFEQAGIAIRLIEGVHVHAINSFPSGHTITAFSVFILIALYSKSFLGGIFSLFLALTAGFSRVYISQHFPIDVLVGAWIGILSSLLVLELVNIWAYRRPQLKWDQTFWNKQ